MIVHARSAYPIDAPGARVRVAEMVEPLGSAGVEMRFAPTLNNDEYRILGSNAPRGRKVMTLLRAAHRVRGTQPDQALSLIHRLLFIARLPGIDPPPRLDVYDFDDALFFGSVSTRNRGASVLKQERRRWSAYVTKARLVTAGNAYLAAEARAAGAARVEVLPTCVEPSRYELARHRDHEMIMVGWIGSRTTTPYLEPVMAAVKRLHDSGHRIRLRLIGAAEFEPQPWLEQRDWSLDREGAELVELDVGVMPMPDTAWARGKCGYKLLQYFAAGLPAIASPVGVGTAMVGGERGILAASIPEWERAILELAADAGARNEIGDGARKYVERNFSYARWAPEFAAMLKEL